MSTIEIPAAHAEAASQFLAQLRAMLQGISGFSYTTPLHRRRIMFTAGVPDLFLQTVAVALEASPMLATSAQVQAADLRDAVLFTNAYEAVANDLELAARALRGTIAERRSGAGVSALRVYSMAKSLNRPSDRSLLIPHIRDMGRTLGRGKGRAAPVADPTTPAQPAPAGVVTPTT